MTISKKSQAFRRSALFQSKCTLKSHFDSVRGIHFLPSFNSLVTASEDCTLKVWDVNKFCNIRDEEGMLNFEPYTHLRGHVAPILSIAGAE